MYKELKAYMFYKDQTRCTRTSKLYKGLDKLYQEYTRLYTANNLYKGLEKLYK